MTAKKEWKAVVYAVDGDAPYKYLALAAYQDGVVTRYSKSGEFKHAYDALLNARDFAMMLNSAGLTPKEEGTTFTKRKLPEGRALGDEDLTAEYAQLSKLHSFVAKMKDLAEGKTSAESTEVPEWLRNLNRKR